MKKVIYSIVIFLLIPFLGNSQNNTKLSSVRVTYIANSSFMVKAGETKILFNGLFQSGMDMYSEPDVHTAFLIKNAMPPYDDVSLVFVSNHNAHQFDPYLATQFLINNTSAKIICPQQVINKMKIFVEDYELVKSQIIETTPSLNNYDRLLLGGIEIIAANVSNPFSINYMLENIAYMVNVEGVKFFHSGDSSAETLSRLNGIRFSDLGIDVAFLADRYGLRNSAEIANNEIDARYNVLMQFEKAVSDQTLDAFANNSRLSSKPHIFKVRNHYIDFYINDFENIFKEFDQLSLN